MAAQVLIHGGHVVRSEGDLPEGWLLVEGGRIVRMGAGEPPDLPGARRIDASGRYVLPGFIDVHVHGAVGCDTMDGSPESLCKMARYYAQHGTTAFLPTTWTESRSKTMAALQAVAEVMGRPTGGAAILGAHMEGPYINPEKRGAQDPRHVRRADVEEATAFLDTGVVRLIALAPEFSENQWLIEHAAARGIVVSAAHTQAGPEDIDRAVALGLRQATHTFNAMDGLHHRKPGTVGAVLTNDAVICELIADGVHVHPLVMKLVVRAKGLDKVILVTDAVSPAGMPDGDYLFEDRPVVVREGRVLLPDGTIAGSTLVMDEGLRQIMRAAGLSLSQAWPLVSLNAARQLGIADRKGRLAEGCDADIVLLDADYQVQMTMVGGEVVFEQGQP